MHVRSGAQLPGSVRGPLAERARSGDPYGFAGRFERERLFGPFARGQEAPHVPCGRLNDGLRMVPRRLSLCHQLQRSLGADDQLREAPLLGKPLAGPEVSWSSRGDLLSTVDNTGALVIREGRGRRTRRIKAVAYKPIWSPDAHRIGYLAKRGAFVINRDGTQRRLVSTHCDRLVGAVAWSPDGRELACRARAGRLLITNIRSRRARSLGMRLPFEIDWQQRP